MLKTLETLNRDYNERFVSRNVILTFEEFLSLSEANPRRYMRSALQYLLDAFDYFGSKDIKTIGGETLKRFAIFDFQTERSGPIIGGEAYQNEIYNALIRFERSGGVSKLVLLHGPNGSAKSSTIETISKALQLYSQTEEGALYRFSWIFPSDKDALPRARGDSHRIGFAQTREPTKIESYALLDDSKIAAKIVSEFNENPLFLLPMPYREDFLRQWIGKKEGTKGNDIELPRHINRSGLSKKNQLIFENLLNGYSGDMGKVLRHIQVERLFFSKQYRIGISTVEPQMSMDASERQLTLDRSYSNLPAVLQTINFHQASGELVEANRGIIEFSDLLKRPVESFKYLLSTIETGTINLPSGTALLDTVFLATTNEKHLDAFKTIPDFSSFKGRFELIRVPYLLSVSQERQIYAEDIKSIEKSKKIAPHTLDLLCTWSVLTRLKQPDSSYYSAKHQDLIKRLDPLTKIRLYEKQPLQPDYDRDEQMALEEIRARICNESVNTSIYEGRFGASPREIRSILLRAAQHSETHDLTPMNIFDELEELSKDKTVYEFLQFEPRNKYHDVDYFNRVIKDEFVALFEIEVMQSMAMADEGEYDLFLRRYVNHVVAVVKNEKIWDEVTNSYQLPSQKFMEDVEKIIEVKIAKEEHRGQLLSRIGSFKIENPKEKIEVSVIFSDYLRLIKQHFYRERKKSIDEIIKAMLRLDTEEAGQIRASDKKLALDAFENLQKIGYSKDATIAAIKFMVTYKPQEAPILPERP